MICEDTTREHQQRELDERIANLYLYFQQFEVLSFTIDRRVTKQCDERKRIANLYLYFEQFEIHLLTFDMRVTKQCEDTTREHQNNMNSMNENEFVFIFSTI